MSLNSNPSDIRTVLVQASHILHQHNVLDGFGHISARDPHNPDTFFQTGTAAALITKPEDFTTYSVHDGSPVTSDNTSQRVSPYSEHYIHAAMYARFPDVMSVLHSHARDVLPFSVVLSPDAISGSSEEPTSSLLRPVIHTAGFLGPDGPPIWDIADAYGPSHDSPKRHHLLVNEYGLAQSLANTAAMATTSSEANTTSSIPSWHRVVLQRGHGLVALGLSIEEAVYNAIYTVENARVLSQALNLCKGPEDNEVYYLSPEEIDACGVMDRDCIPKVWPLWLREIERNAFWQ